MTRRTPIQQAAYTLRGTAHGLTMDGYDKDAETLEQLADAVEAEYEAYQAVHAHAAPFAAQSPQLKAAIAKLVNLQKEQKR